MWAKRGCEHRGGEAGDGTAKGVPCWWGLPRGAGEMLALLRGALG